VDEIERLRERKEFGVKTKKNGEDLGEIKGVGYEGFREREGKRREKVSKVEEEMRGRETGTVVKNLDRGP